MVVNRLVDLYLLPDDTFIAQYVPQSKRLIWRIPVSNLSTISGYPARMPHLTGFPANTIPNVPLTCPSTCLWSEWIIQQYGPHYGSEWARYLINTCYTLCIKEEESDTLLALCLQQLEYQSRASSGRSHNYTSRRCREVEVSLLQSIEEAEDEADTLTRRATEAWRLRGIVDHYTTSEGSRSESSEAHSLRRYTGAGNNPGGSSDDSEIPGNVSQAVEHGTSFPQERLIHTLRDHIVLQRLRNQDMAMLGRSNFEDQGIEWDDEGGERPVRTCPRDDHENTHNPDAITSERVAAESMRLRTTSVTTPIAAASDNQCVIPKREETSRDKGKAREALVPNAFASSSHVPVEEVPSTGGDQKRRSCNKKQEGRDQSTVIPPPPPPPPAPRVGRDPPSSDGSGDSSESEESSSGDSNSSSVDSDFHEDLADITAGILDRLQGRRGTAGAGGEPDGGDSSPSSDDTGGAVIGTGMGTSEDAAQMKYSGGKDLKVFEGHITAMCRWMALMGLGGPACSEKHILTHGFHLTGTAREWYEAEAMGVYRKKRHWTHLEMILGMYDRFIDTSVVQKATEDFWSCKFAPEIGVTGFFYELWNAAERMVKCPHKYTFRNTFMGRLPGPMVKYLLDRNITAEYCNIKMILEGAMNYEWQQSVSIRYVETRATARNSHTTKDTSIKPTTRRTTGERLFRMVRRGSPADRGASQNSKTRPAGSRDGGGKWVPRGGVPGTPE
ncbi:hypothetical protein DFH07DRAFT_783931 [Mycena maculata]|uniref:Uncharacterized protein n=1 Tax=Mycena maculata TaxID=230809 RepID=A0AAD7HJH9_9AGAR|nr:hypothetical protein DFH07DRAFT_783931 [Mycena maculata]